MSTGDISNEQFEQAVNLIFDIMPDEDEPEKHPPEFDREIAIQIKELKDLMDYIEMTDPTMQQVYKLLFERLIMLEDKGLEMYNESLKIGSEDQQTTLIKSAKNAIL